MANHQGAPMSRDPMGRLVLWLFGGIILIFVGAAASFQLIRSRVSPQELETRHRIALDLAKRNWSDATIGGKIVDGKADESGLPPLLPGPSKVAEAEHYSDTFNTYTIYEFEDRERGKRFSIRVGATNYGVHVEPLSTADAVK